MVTQEGFRARNDDGSETTATWAADQDATFPHPLDTNLRLRVLLDAAGDPAPMQFRLDYKRSTGSTWSAIPTSSPVAGTVDKAIVLGTDDGHQIGTTVTLNDILINGSLDATNEWAGLRFQDVAIPVGATITAAYITIVPSGSGQDEPLVTIYMEDADNPSTFTTDASNISDRPRTSGVAWSSTDLGATGTSAHNSPSLVSIVQAVVDRSGWASGNAMAVIIQGGSDSVRDLAFKSFENTANTPPLLHIEYTVPAPILISASSNLTAGGEDTTAQLTSPAGKTASDFQTGRAWDDENGTDALDLTADKYTELEWCLKALAANGAANGQTYHLRVTDAGTPLDTYSHTIAWVIGTSLDGSPIGILMNYYDDEED